jgi:N-acetylglucosaminyldiphosphoundecaprenol N-acetyl-beta-D-mannosaminyltransferase
MRVTFLDLPVDIASMEETIDLALKAMHSGHRMQHVALNVAKLVRAGKDPLLKHDLESADFVGIDGMGIVIGLGLAGMKGAERVAGIDLMMGLLERCAKEGLKPYFLGATPEVLSRAVEVAQQRFPGLRLAGARDGFFSDEEEAGVVAAIRASKADCLFVGMPTPRKERFLARYRDDLNVPFIMGVGGSFDVLAGHVSRAPLWMQKSGLEWLHRVLQEPGRMWKRYATTNLAYVRMLGGVLMRRLAR